MEKYLSIIRKTLAKIKPYLPIILFTIVGATYGYLVLTASQQSSLQPTDAEINENITKSSRPRVDEASAEKLEQLESQNVEIQAIFDEARKNPFSE